MKIRNRLKYWRHQLMMNVSEYAEFLGVHQSQVSRWEKSNETNKSKPSAETLYRIFVSLRTRFPDMHMEDLFEEDPK